jgi:hypothetical protein
MFRVAPPLELKKLEAIFRHKVLRMLLNKGKITQEMIVMLSTWRHSGFNVLCGNRISPNDDTAMENLARYIIRASFSQERMQYLDQAGTVVYRSRHGETTKSFPALEWLAAMCSHIPNPDLDRDNASRGKRRKEGSDEAIPCILESQGDEKTFRRNWARLIQKIYEADPLVCPKLVPAKAGMSGRHEGHRLHRGPFGHPRHSRTPGVMAGKSQAAAQNP